METNLNFMRYFFMALIGVMIFIMTDKVWLRYIASFVIFISFIVVTINTIFSSKPPQYG